MQTGNIIAVARFLSPVLFYNNVALCLKKKKKKKNFCGFFFLAFFWNLFGIIWLPAPGNPGCSSAVWSCGIG